MQWWPPFYIHSFNRDFNKFLLVQKNSCYFLKVFVDWAGGGESFLTQTKVGYVFSWWLCPDWEEQEPHRDQPADPGADLVFSLRM